MSDAVPPGSAAARRRPLPLVLLDLIAGSAVLLFTAVLAMVAGGIVGAFPESWLVLLCTALLVAGWFGSLGMFLLRAVQRRWAGFWPVLGGLMIVAVLYGGSALQVILL